VARHRQRRRAHVDAGCSPIVSDTPKGSRFEWIVRARSGIGCAPDGVLKAWIDVGAPDALQAASASRLRPR